MAQTLWRWGALDGIAILTQACTCDAHADERWDAPPRDLEQALIDEGMPRAFVKTVPLGQTQDIETMESTGS